MDYQDSVITLTMGRQQFEVVFDILQAYRSGKLIIEFDPDRQAVITGLNFTFQNPTQTQGK